MATMQDDELTFGCEYPDIVEVTHVVGPTEAMKATLFAHHTMIQVSPMHIDFENEHALPPPPNGLVFWSLFVDILPEGRGKRSEYHYRTTDSPRAGWMCSFSVPIPKPTNGSRHKVRLTLWRTTIAQHSSIPRRGAVAQGNVLIDDEAVVQAGQRGLSQRAFVAMAFLGGVVRCGIATLGLSVMPPDTAEPDDLERIGFLGCGAFSKVELVRRKSDGRHFAAKKMLKDVIRERKVVEGLVTEREVLLHLRHPFLVPLHFAIETETSYIFGLEVAVRDLFAVMQSRPLNEREVRFFASEIVEVLDFLHSNRVVYRDLKPENFLISREGGHIMLCDLGLSYWDTNHTDKRELCGSAEYWAPEVILYGRCGPAQDYWAFGVCLFEMIFGGRLPFGIGQDDDLESLSSKVCYAPLKWPEGTAISSAEARSLIGELLERDTTKRINKSSVIRGHTFFNGVDWDAVSRRETSSPIKTITL